MKSTEVRSISDVYIYASDCYNKPLNEALADSWRNVLRQYMHEEVMIALADWQSDTESGNFGKTRGSQMPTPADLKRLIVRARAKQEGERITTANYCGRCNHTGWLFVLRDGSLFDSRRHAKEWRAAQMCECNPSLAVADSRPQLNCGGDWKKIQAGDL